jgi:hypothetical protein
MYLSDGLSLGGIAGLRCEYLIMTTKQLTVTLRMA